MFDRIAGLYDRMNSVMTAGLHHEWRRRAADLANLSPGDRALDIATGTGDLALELSTRVAPGGEVVGVDFSEKMLELARAKAGPRGAHVRFESGNALSLGYADGEFDASTVGFGARNFSDLDRGLAEMVRVVRPGGFLVGADSLASNELREFHRGDTYNPVDPSRLLRWLHRLGCRPISITVDQHLTFVARIAMDAV